MKVKEILNLCDLTFVKIQSSESNSVLTNTFMFKGVAQDVYSDGDEYKKYLNSEIIRITHCNNGLLLTIKDKNDTKSAGDEK